MLCTSQEPVVVLMHVLPLPLCIPFLVAGGLPPQADEMSVWEAVIPAGEVIGVQLIRRKRDRGDCRGYGEWDSRCQRCQEFSCTARPQAGCSCLHMAVFA